VDQLDVGARKPLDVLAARTRRLTQALIAEIREVRVVELEVAAAGRSQRMDFLAVDARKVSKEVLEVRICMPIDRRATASEVHHRRRGHRLLCSTGRDRQEKAKVLDLDSIRGTAQLARDDGDERHLVGTAARRVVGAKLGALDLVDERAVEAFAPELPVRDALEAERLLERDRFADGLVL